MSFGKLTAAAFSGSIENTLALASLNFDFSLVKVEPPAEYKDLGISLSQRRSKEAEHGIAHITARKLGALFSAIVPHTPNLIRAYGIRASEVGKSAYNPQNIQAEGIFADHIGADGTSIWAAATSGNAAIAIHLLACMLARIWTGSEATSIWVELVAERKHKLSACADNGEAFDLATMTASEISLTRDQLAQWDASARAWLLTADAAKELQQKQLMLIINNIGTPVDCKATVYDSVLATWKTAMMAVDNLVAGMPQSIYGGAALLGLSSWHLYPDLLVLGVSTKEVHQADLLIAEGGIATIGLGEKQSTRKGIRWSLPLAHLQFYGDPVLVTRVMGPYSAKLSIDQFLQVALGSFLWTWTTSYVEIDIAAEVLILMCDFLAVSYRQALPWLQALADPARKYLLSKGEDRYECLRLIKCGCRRYASFFDKMENLPPPILGLSVPKTLISLITDSEERIWMLREVAQRLPGDTHSMIIRSCVRHIYRDTGGRFNVTRNEWCYECATVSPVVIRNRGLKRDSDGSVYQPGYGQMRWTEIPKYDETKVRLQQLRSTGEEIIPIDTGTFKNSTSDGYGFSWNHAPQHMVDLAYSDHNTSFYTAQQANSCVQFKFVLGDPETAGLYSFQKIQQSNSFLLPDLKAVLLRNSLSADKTANYFLQGLNDDEDMDDNPSEESDQDCNVGMNETSQIRRRYGIDQRGSSIIGIIRSLQALDTMLEVYKFMPEANLSIKAAQRPLYTSKWFLHHQRMTDSFQRYVMSRAQTFACIAMFESGSLNLNPDSLNSVMAMSIGNSIYVAAPLLADPFNKYRGNSIKRVIGNVGKPGIAMMVPPRNPKRRVLQDDEWHCINHDQFQGNREDLFQGTTLHLSFSDWEMPVDIGNRSGRDSEVSFIEAPVSVHDKGNWVADIDILKILADPRFLLKSNHRDCDCVTTTYNADVDFASIDSWEELLEPPLEEGIVRAHGNWQARLAAAAISVQDGHTTVVLSKDFCWNCYDIDAKDGHDVLDFSLPENMDGGTSMIDEAQDTWSSSHAPNEEIYEDDWDEKDNSSSCDFDTGVGEQIRRGYVSKASHNRNVIYIM